MSDDRLDPGLAAAFGREARPAESVLRRLDPTGALASRVVLLDEGAEPPTPILAPRASTEGRYQLVGEIARGGVGVVMKGHDIDLGRDVALKFLRDEHARNPELLQRFVEEAQIGGQLQHPGIVPVYELGLRRDDRPFFTMKLVKGRTLASLLGDSPAGDAEKRRFLGIFESVCRTMAYAHSRGVIHRDLKPANVMVGAFGEVLVVDWGLGKVLGRPPEPRPPQQSVIATVRSGTGTQSQSGSILGTPAYMPPEQARGEIDLLDERADVFSLGALLCEILTGKPPYVGDELLKAARADLAEAFARLDACGADAELRDLAKSCLAPAAEARPRNAGAVASEIARFSASLEEKARTAQLEAAEAEERASEERRRRRLGIALAAALLALLLVGGGGWLRLDGARRDRETAAARAANEAMGEATRLRGRERWAEARSSATRAVLLAHDADRATAERAKETHEKIERLAREASERAAADERDRRLLEELDRVRETEFRTRDYPRKDRLYVEAFRAWGVDFDGMEPGRIADLLRPRPNAPEAVLEIDYWLAIATPERRRALAEVAGRLDADPWRARLRSATTREDLVRLAGDAGSARVESRVALAVRLAELGDRARAVAILRSAWMDAPDNPRLNRLLGMETSVTGSVRNPDAIRFASAAVALRPRSPFAQGTLAFALRRGGRFEEALFHSREALRLGSDDAALRHGLVLALLDLGRLDEALAEAEAAARAMPGEAAAVQCLSAVQARRGDFAGAIATARRALALDPDDLPALATLVEALNESGGAPAEAVSLARRVVELAPDSAEGRLGLSEALRRAGDHAEAMAALREAIRLDPSYLRPREVLSELLLEQGDDAGAVEQARAMIRRSPDHPSGHFRLAAALRSRGEWEKGLASLRRSVALSPDSAAVRSNAALEFSRMHRFSEAAAEYRVAFDLAGGGGGSTSVSAALLARYESAAAVAQRLDRYLAGEHRPSDLAQRAELANMAGTIGRHDVAIDLWMGCLEFAPGGLFRINAAYHAIRSGSGLGSGASLGWDARAGLRAKAREWIVDDLAKIGTLDEEALRGLREWVATWRSDPGLALIHDDLAALPKDEQIAWERVWERIAEFLETLR